MNRRPREAWWSGPLYEVLDTACRYLLLSLLWTAGAALLVTAPAATSALLATVRGWAEGDGRPVGPTFLTQLRHGARTSTAAAAILLPFAALLVVNAAIVPHMGAQRPYATVVLTALGIPFLVFATNLLPAVAGRVMGVREAGRRTVERIVRQPVAAGVTTAVALLAAACVYVQPVGALLVAAPAARLVVAAGRPTAQPVTPV